jgi:formiminoglutamase
LHQSYTSKSVLDKLKTLKERVLYNTYDSMKIKKTKDFNTEMDFALDFINNDFYGIEIDLDAIPNIASSAMTLSGFSVEELRQFIYFFGKNNHASYLHICEGAPELDYEKNNHLVGKLIGYLVTDFIKARTEITV